MSSLVVFGGAWIIVVISGSSAVRKGKISRSTYTALLGVMAGLTVAMVMLLFVRGGVRRDVPRRGASAAAATGAH